MHTGHQLANARAQAGLQTLDHARKFLPKTSLISLRHCNAWVVKTLATSSETYKNFRFFLYIRTFFRCSPDIFVHKIENYLGCWPKIWCGIKWRKTPWTYITWEPWQPTSRNLWNIHVPPTPIILCAAPITCRVKNYVFFVLKLNVLQLANF